jgi:hypothetical protein
VPGMKRVRVFLACAALVACAQARSQIARAEDAPFARYQASQELGQIEITTGFMERLDGLEARILALEAGGTVVLETSAGRRFERATRIGGHPVRTSISIAPPVGHGEGGASSNADLLVVVDRDTVVSCPLSYASLGLDRISIDPARRFVTLIGHQGMLHFDGFESRRVIDEDWLYERANAVRALLCGSSPPRK